LVSAACLSSSDDDALLALGRLITNKRTPRDDHASMRALAVRIRRRRAEWERAHPGYRIPISDTVSRILSHDDRYEPKWQRRAAATRRPLLNPGVFTLAAIARELGTTVGDLLDEPRVNRPQDALTLQQRRALRSLVETIWQLFDLGDPAVEAAAEANGEQ